MESYAVFIYVCGGLTWSGNATIGFNAGDYFFENHPVSGMLTADSVSCTNVSRTAWTNLVYKLTHKCKY